MTQTPYWTADRLIQLAGCLRNIATKTDDGNLAITGDDGVARQVAPTYWRTCDEGAQLYFIQKALSMLAKAGVLDMTGAKVKGVPAVRYVNPDVEQTKALISAYCTTR